jgi:hypothetical protein
MGDYPWVISIATGHQISANSFGMMVAQGRS